MLLYIYILEKPVHWPYKITIINCSWWNFFLIVIACVYIYIIHSANKSHIECHVEWIVKFVPSLREVNCPIANWLSVWPSLYAFYIVSSANVNKLLFMDWLHKMGSISSYPIHIHTANKNNNHWYQRNVKCKMNELSRLLLLCLCHFVIGSDHSASSTHGTDATQQ